MVKISEVSLSRIVDCDIPSFLCLYIEIQGLITRDKLTIQVFGEAKASSASS